MVVCTCIREQYFSRGLLLCTSVIGVPIMRSLSFLHGPRSLEVEEKNQSPAGHCFVTM